MTLVQIIWMIVILGLGIMFIISLAKRLGASAKVRMGMPDVSGWYGRCRDYLSTDTGKNVLVVCLLVIGYIGIMLMIKFEWPARWARWMDSLQVFILSQVLIVIAVCLMAYMKKGFLRKVVVRTLFVFGALGLVLTGYFDSHRKMIASLDTAIEVKKDSWVQISIPICDSFSVVHEELDQVLLVQTPKGEIFRIGPDIPSPQFGNCSLLYAKTDGADKDIVHLQAFKLLR